jgi:hypothetical protein
VQATGKFFETGLPDGISLNRKILIWVNFGGTCNRRCWYILFPFGLFYDHFVYFVVIWSILWSFGLFCGHLVYLWLFGIFFPVLVWCEMKNLATLPCEQTAKPFLETRSRALRFECRKRGRKFFNCCRVFAHVPMYVCTCILSKKVWEFFKLAFPSGAGRPDWANFQHLGDFLTLSKSI